MPIENRTIEDFKTWPTWTGSFPFTHEGVKFIAQINEEFLIDEYLVPWRLPNVYTLVDGRIRKNKINKRTPHFYTREYPIINGSNTVNSGIFFMLNQYEIYKDCPFKSHTVSLYAALGKYGHLTDRYSCTGTGKTIEEMVKSTYPNIKTRELVRSVLVSQLKSETDYTREIVAMAQPSNQSLIRSRVELSNGTIYSISGVGLTMWLEYYFADNRSAEHRMLSYIRDSVKVRVVN